MAPMETAQPTASATVADTADLSFGSKRPQVQILSPRLAVKANDNSACDRAADQDHTPKTANGYRNGYRSAKVNPSNSTNNAGAPKATYASGGLYASTPLRKGELGHPVYFQEGMAEITRIIGIWADHENASRHGIIANLRTADDRTFGHVYVRLGVAR